MKSEEIAMTLAGIVVIGFIVWSLSKRSEAPVTVAEVSAPALQVMRPQAALWFSASVQPQTSAQRSAPADFGCGCGG